MPTMPATRPSVRRMQPAPRLSAGGDGTFGSLLRRHRVLAGLSQEALAARAGLSRRGIADLERGARRSPYPDTARRLAAALRLRGTDRDEFMASCRPGPILRADRYTISAEPSGLIGRQRELADLSRLLSETRLLTMTGVGGIGKTRLALELVHRAMAAYDAGAVVVDFAPVVDAAGLPDAVAAALGVAASGGEPVADAVCDHLQGKQLLIMLDNCEHVVAGSARLVDMLLRRTSAVRLLVTSREPLRIRGETAWMVPPLELGEAVELFIQRATAATATRPLTPAEVATIDTMCRHLEGIPLAIELAAVRVPTLGVDQVAVRLTDRLAFLSRGNRLDPPRHQTLRAALDWSYALLDAAEQRLFTRLAVFVGGWRLESVEAVSDPGDESLGTVLDSLTGLIDKSLVQGEEVGVGRRYRFLETIREYALELLEASGEERRVRDRHAACVLQVAESGAVTRLGVRYPGDTALVRLEHANFLAALRWLHEQDRPADGLALCQALSGFWLGQGLLREGADWLGVFLAESARLSPHAAAEGWHACGRLTEYAGDLDRARELFDRSRATSIAHGDAVVASRALGGLGDVALHHTAYDDALDLFRQSLAWAQRADSPSETAQALLSLGRAADLLGDVRRSKDWLEQSLTIERQLGDRWGVAYVLQVLGEQARRAGQLVQAQTMLEEGHVLWRLAGTLMGERAAVMNLAMVTLERGRPVRAGELASEALELSLQLRDAGSATTVRAVEIAAQVLWALYQTPDAVGLMAAAGSRRDALETPRPAVEQPDVDLLLDTARSLLGDAAFHRAWADGLTLTMDQAVEVAATAVSASAVAH